MARKGEVTLSGSVENTAQAERAVQVVRGVEGLQRVEDKLVRESKLDVPATPKQSNRPMPRWITPTLTSDTQSSRVRRCLIDSESLQ